MGTKSDKKRNTREGRAREWMGRGMVKGRDTGEEGDKEDRFEGLSL